MNGYFKTGRCDEVSRLFAMFGYNGLEHDAVSYGIMLQTLFRREDGLNLFKVMQVTTSAAWYI